MKYRGHETFSIRRNWLAKGILAVSSRNDIFTGKEIDPMDELGIGRNMVFSLRYWLKACGITKEEKDLATKRMKMVFTPLGELIKEYDRYVEETGTLWLLHSELAQNREYATSWYYFFNEFNLSEFTKNDFVRGLQSFDEMNGGKTAPRSFEDDFECILNTYLPHSRNGTDIDPEDNIESPFAELGLIDSRNTAGRIYRKTIPPKQNIPPLIALSLLYENAKDYRNFEIPLSDIQNKEKSLGKIFNLDTVTLMEILGELENREYIKIIRTAGLDVVTLQKDITKEDCIRKYFEGL